MFPTKTFKLIVFATNLAWLNGTIPFRFQKDLSDITGHAKKLTTTFTKWRTIFCCTTFCINLSYSIFIALRLFYKVYFRNESLTFALPMGYQYFAFTQIVVFQSNTLFMWKETPAFCIRYLECFQRFKDRYGLQGESACGPKCLKFFKAWFFIAVLVNLQNILLIIKKPTRAHYFTSVLDNPLKAPLITRLPLTLLQCVVWATGWSQVIASCFHLYAYFCGLVWIVRELDIGVKLPKTVDSLRNPNVFTRELRSFHVLHRIWEQAYQGWFCPAHKFVAICVATLGSYGVIKLSGPPSYTMGCMATIALMYMWTLFSKFGQLHDMSRNMLTNWMNHPRSTKWLRKFSRSVPVFSVRVGHFYKVQRMTVFTALSTVLDNTITILLL